MSQSQLKNTLDPYYNPNNVFERDQAYYSQMLNGTRRNTLSRQGRQSSRSPLQRSQNPQFHQSRLSPSRGLNQSSVSFANNVVGNPMGSTTNLNGNRQYQQALEANATLKEQISRMVKGQSDFGTSANVIKLSHYNVSSDQTQILKEHELQISKLQEIIKNNEVKISQRKRITQQLSVRMTNIQQIDKEIYKNLQGSINRDKILLEKASSALARGERREQVAKILHQVLL